ncbi:hypothetical protein [Dyella sp.]|uniref:hypothetical protein n=1 Tax=Dyella sp. TaxID=1869338 RepID=UPI002D79AD1D|nr:hypothetical protein [Dyella sp.]HET7331836.1 hypothetical protein [Dyella sp.]
MATLISVVLSLIVYAALNHHISDMERVFLLAGVVVTVRIGIAIDRNWKQLKKEERFQASMLANYHEVLKLPQPMPWHAGEYTVTIENQKSFGRRGSPKCIVLFLRPFVLDKEFRVINPVSTWKSMIPFYSLAVPSMTTLDDAISIAIHGYGELIAIGDKAGDIGATRLQTSEENWQKTFAKLAEAASAIVVYTSDRSGTAWETGKLLSQPAWLAKSIFILPPVTAAEKVRGESLHAAKDLLRKFGCNVPDTVGHGDGVTFSRTKSVETRIKLLGPRLIELELKSAELKKLIAKVGI